jgi:hypothetical protein
VNNCCSCAVAAVHWVIIVIELGAVQMCFVFLWIGCFSVKVRIFVIHSQTMTMINAVARSGVLLFSFFTITLQHVQL